MVRMERERGMEDSDRALAHRVVAEGDEEAFRALYRRHTPHVYQLVLRFLGGSEQEAEDVVQDTWVRTVEALPGFRWEAKLSTWIIGIALNRAREELRRNGKRRAREVGGAAAFEPISPPAAVPERVDLERAIRGLPDGYRSVLVLHDVEGFTHEEIGRRLEITVGTSRSQLFHARRAVRKALGGSL